MKDGVWKLFSVKPKRHSGIHSGSFQLQMKSLAVKEEEERRKRRLFMELTGPPPRGEEPGRMS